jgi:O-antigen/teichoic acid export membrane protein
MSASRSKVTRNSLILLAAQASTRAIGLLVLVLLANYLGTDPFGKYSFALAFVMLFTPLLDFGLDALSVREVARDHSKAATYFGSSLILKTFLSIGVFLLVLAVINLLPYDPLTRQLVYIAAFISILRVFQNSCVSLFRAHQVMEYEAAILIAVRLAETAFILLAICVFRSSLGRILLLMLCGNALGLLFAVLVAVRRITLPRFVFDWPRWKQLLKDGAPFALTGVFVMLYFRVDNVMLSLMEGDSAVGMYNSASNLVYPLTFASAAIAAALFPSLARDFHVRRGLAFRSYRKAVLFSLAMGIFLAVTLTLFADLIFDILYIPEFSAAASTLRIICWLLPVSFVTILFGNTLGAIDKQILVFRVAVINALVNVALNYLLIPILSYDGAALATVVTELVGFCILSYLMSKHFHPDSLRGLLTSRDKD